MASFTETLQLAADLKPEVVLMDLHMPGEEKLDPSLVKIQLLHTCKHVLAMSFSTDDEAQPLARSYGAMHLLDKTKLGSELLATIKSLDHSTSA